MALISVFYLIRYFKDAKLPYTALDSLNLVILTAAIYLLLRGRKNIASIILFPIYGNIYLIRILLLAIFLPFEVFPFVIELYYAFQILIMLGTSYFCRQRRFLWITLLIALICNTLYIAYDHNYFFSSAVFSYLVFILLPAFFGMHINRSRFLLEDFYRSNVGRNREVNHRIKNHLSMLKSMLVMRAADYGSEKDIQQELSNTITSFMKIYDRLLYTENIHRLNFYQYVHALMSEYRENMGLKFNLRMNDRELSIDSEKAAHLGMVITELVSNSYKYADAKNLEIEIAIVSDIDTLRLVYYDNGKGGIDDSDCGNASFGRAIIKSIVVDTLGGRLDIDDSFSFKMDIPMSSIRSLSLTK